MKTDFWKPNIKLFQASKVTLPIEITIPLNIVTRTSSLSQFLRFIPYIQFLKII